MSSTNRIRRLFAVVIASLTVMVAATAATAQVQPGVVDPEFSWLIVYHQSDLPAPINTPNTPVYVDGLIMLQYRESRQMLGGSNGIGDWVVDQVIEDLNTFSYYWWGTYARPAVVATGNRLAMADFGGMEYNEDLHTCIGSPQLTMACAGEVHHNLYVDSNNGDFSTIGTAHGEALAEVTVAGAPSTVFEGGQRKSISGGAKAWVDVTVDEDGGTVSFAIGVKINEKGQLGPGAEIGYSQTVHNDDYTSIKTKPFDVSGNVSMDWFINERGVDPATLQVDSVISVETALEDDADWAGALARTELTTFNIGFLGSPGSYPPALNNCGVAYTPESPHSPGDPIVVVKSGSSAPGATYPWTWQDVEEE